MTSKRLMIASFFAFTAAFPAGAQPVYERRETRALVALVHDAASLIRAKGEAAFADLRLAGGRRGEDETYLFVLDPDGNMLLHPDPALEGRNVLELKDVNGKPIIRGLIDAATALKGKPEGWYHYEWPVPGGILPRWKSSYVRLAAGPSGKSYIVGGGMYDDRMERSFVVDLVKDAAGLIEKDGEAAFRHFHDPAGRFIAKDAYIFVLDPSGIDLVNPAFPNLEGRNILDVKDAQGKRPIREMLEVARSSGAGWVDYMWPKPGENVPTRKSAYVTKVKTGDRWLLAGSGVYLPGAPKATRPAGRMTAPQLMRLVHEGKDVLEKRGEAAFPQFREKGSKWFRDGAYFFVWDLDGTRLFHAADASLEGRNGGDAKDILGRPYGRMFLEAAAGSAGEGWAHYMYPEPGSLFPAWKSVFLKRAVLPSGRRVLIGCGSYDMKMDRALIEDVVERASELVASRGEEAFGRLRDKTGPFVFLDTYVFVDTPEGVVLVNPGQPSLEGKNIIDLKDAKGKAAAREYIAAAMTKGEGWADYYWYRPGQSTLAHKWTYVKKVRSGGRTYIVGSGFYADANPQHERTMLRP